VPSDLYAIAYLPTGEGREMVHLEVERATRIAGGFVLVPVVELMHAWRASRSAPLGIGDFRVWLAMREMVARRQALPEGREPAYGLAELANLLGVTRKRAGASVRRLEAAALIAWSDSAIGFVDPRVEEVDLDDTIGRGKGSVAIPRRMLRFLVAGAKPAIIATALGVLLRCLSRRSGGFDGRGRVKASWIVRTFGMSIPAVKVSRRELVELGWIAPEPSDQWTENRWGRAFRIDLGWSNLATSSEPDSIPPRPDPGPSSIPPDLHPEPLREFKDQEPASGGPAGVEIKGQGGEIPGYHPLLSTRQQVAPQDHPPGHHPDALEDHDLAIGESRPPGVPTLADVRIEDLKDTGRLLDLHRQAVDRGFVGASEADRLAFVAAAEHALAIGKGNPPGLFAWLVRNGCWRYATLDDEGAARRKLHLHQHDRFGHVVDERPRVTSWSSPGFSEDARVVREIRTACIRAGVYRDPWPAFSARNSGWDRRRWDAAMAELGLA
jgi:hypothetical protein